MRARIGPAVFGTLAVAGLSTLGDFVWATWIPQHRPIYGLVHGTLLFCGIGLALGFPFGRRLAGAGLGALIGVLAAGSFYVLSPLTGYRAMFLVWIAVWLGLGVLSRYLEPSSSRVQTALLRGTAAALGSGVAFFLVSGIWLPFNPQSWDYLVHFGAWTLAYLPGFAALLVGTKPIAVGELR